MARIAFIDYVCDPSKPGTTGLSDLVWDMASRLARSGDDVHVIAPYTVDVSLEPRVHVHRFTLPPIAYRNIVGHILIILRAIHVVKQLGPFDVIHAPEYVSSAGVSLLASETPFVFTEPGNIYERIANGNPYDWTTTQVYKLAARLAARKCAYCIATSEEMRTWWMRTGVAENRISLVPLGVDTQLFRPIAEARSMLGLPTERHMVVYAARLSRENGADVTLRAIARLVPSMPDIELHMLGDGPEQATLRELAVTLGIDKRVVWHGWVDFHRLPLFYSAADVFAFSGYSGGTPRVMLQAMACGAPVVASAIGGITDHIRDGEHGRLFLAGDDAALAHWLLQLLQDRQQARYLGQRGQAYVYDTVSWDTVISRIQAIYAEVSHRPHLHAV